MRRRSGHEGWLFAKDRTRSSNDSVRGVAGWHGCMPPDCPEFAAQHEQVLYVFHDAGAEWAVRGLQDAKAVQPSSRPSLSVSEDPQEHLDTDRGKVGPILFFIPSEKSCIQIYNESTKAFSYSLFF